MSILKFGDVNIGPIVHVYTDQTFYKNMMALDANRIDFPPKMPKLLNGLGKAIFLETPSKFIEKLL